MQADLGYAGKDLEAMSFAVNYHRWILAVFAPYLGTRLVEVGAGTGSFTELLLEHRPQSLSLVEPAPEMFQQLAANMNQCVATNELKLFNDTFERVSQDIRSTAKPDSIIYVNVLEHIADDERELKVINETLDPSGRIFIFVPAFAWLYGSFDREINHYRRYSRNDLEDKCRRAGFKIILSRYFDFFGVLPWWIKYRVLKSKTMEPGAVKLYDQMIVPLARTLEVRMPPMLGKNVLLIGEKL